MVRDYRMETPAMVNRTYTRKNRRRMDIPLNIPGAEMHLPSLPAFRLSTSWLAVLLLATLLAAGYFLWNAPFFQVQSAQVLGNSRVDANDINAVLGINGKPIFALRAAELEQSLLAAFPEIASVAVQIELPSSVQARVVERVPVLTWRQGDTIQLIDQEGFAFPLRLTASAVISPVLEATGNPPRVGLASQDAAALLADQLAASAENPEQVQAGEQPVQAPEKQEPLLEPEMVSSILSMASAAPQGAVLVYQPEHGLGWLDARGWQVYFGDAQDIAAKLDVYDAILLRLEDEEIQPALISVEHVHNPYFRLER
jgi:cell division septal protein FtsQ